MRRVYASLSMGLDVPTCKEDFPALRRNSDQITLADVTHSLLGSIRDSIAFTAEQQIPSSE